MVRRIHRLGLLPEFGIAGYKDSRHKNDKLSAHELLQNANLFDPKKLKAQSAMDNIELNTNLTRYGIYIGLLRRGWEKIICSCLCNQTRFKFKSFSDKFC